MKKKLFAVALTAVLGLSVGNSALAAFNSVQTVPSEGYIGPYDEDTGFQPNTIVNVSLPMYVNWYVTERTDGQVRVQSPQNFTITNYSERANLRVTFDSYTQTNDVTLPGTLTLNLTGDLAADGLGQDIASGNGTGTFNTILRSMAGAGSSTAGDTWNFGFGGTYVGTIPARALQPTYDMVLKFEVDSYSTN